MKRNNLLSLILICVLSVGINTSAKTIVIAGSSSIYYWDNADKDLAPHMVINKGIRGSTVNDWIKIYKRKITSYKPDVVVLYIGGNDIRLNNGKYVAKRIQSLILKIRSALPSARIYYVSINPTPKHPERIKQKNICNNEMRKFCSKHMRITYIHTANYYDKKLYRKDQIHLNKKGYQKIWKNIVAKKIKSDLI